MGCTETVSEAENKNKISSPSQHMSRKGASEEYICSRLKFLCNKSIKLLRLFILPQITLVRRTGFVERSPLWKALKDNKE